MPVSKQNSSAKINKKIPASAAQKHVCETKGCKNRAIDKEENCLNPSFQRRLSKIRAEEASVANKARRLPAMWRCESCMEWLGSGRGGACIAVKRKAPPLAVGRSDKRTVRSSATELSSVSTFQEQSFLLHNPTIQDALCLVFSFLENPRTLRVLCSFTFQVFQHALFYELPLNIAQVRILPYQFASLGTSSELEESSNTTPGQHQQKDEDGECQKAQSSGEDQLLFVPISPIHRIATSPLLGNRIVSVTLCGVAGITSLNDPFRKPYGYRNLVEEENAEKLPWQRTFYDEKGRVHQWHIFFQPLDDPDWTPGKALTTRKPTTLKHFRLCNMPELTQLGDDFLCNCPDLVSAEFENLPLLESVGSNWVQNCPKLNRILLEKIPNLQTVGAAFLQDCPAFDSNKRTDATRTEGGVFSLQSLASIERIPEGLLQQQKGKMDSMPSITSYHGNLTSVVFSNMPLLGQIGANVLDGVSTLEDIQVSHLPSLREIRPGFACGCPRLRKLVFRDLGALTKVCEPFCLPVEGSRARLHAIIEEVPLLNSSSILFRF